MNSTLSQAFQNAHAISMMILKKAYGNSTPSQVVNHGKDQLMEEEACRLEIVKPLHPALKHV